MRFFRASLVAEAGSMPAMHGEPMGGYDCPENPEENGCGTTRGIGGYEPVEAPGNCTYWCGGQEISPPLAACMSPTVGGENGWLFTTTLLVPQLRWWNVYCCCPTPLGYTVLSPP